MTPIATSAPPPPPPRRMVPPAPATNGNGVNGTHTPPLLPPRSGSMTESGPSWEERTWKELTRLRENMFWARMGAVKPGSGDEEDLASP